MMKRVKKLPYKAENLFDIVMDIEAYPSFLPNCKSAKIIERSENLIIADLAVGNFFFKEKFRSEVNFCRPDRIKISSKGSMIKNLEALWQFIELDNETEVSFEIEISMQSKWMQSIVLRIFDEFFIKILKAFESRACNHIPRS